MQWIPCKASQEGKILTISVFSMNSNSLNFFAKGTHSKEYPTNSRKCIMKIYPKGSNRNKGRKE